VLLGVLLVFAIVAALFDWNWFRQPQFSPVGNEKGLALLPSP
jgi:hypothetical protein